LLENKIICGLERFFIFGWDPKVSPPKAGIVKSLVDTEKGLCFGAKEYKDNFLEHHVRKICFSWTV
jgi:hypothetical protein